MAYQNPIPCLPDEEKYYEFRIHFKFQEPLTKKEAAESLTEYFRKNGISGEYLYADKLHYDYEK